MDSGDERAGGPGRSPLAPGSPWARKFEGVATVSRAPLIGKGERMALWVVTGGSGFLGRHLLEALTRSGERGSGIEVVVLGRRCPIGWPPGRFVAADLGDPAVLGWVIGGIAPDVVFHLAGQTPPASAGAFYRGNTLATVHLLDALRDRR